MLSIIYRYTILSTILYNILYTLLYTILYTILHCLSIYLLAAGRLDLLYLYIYIYEMLNWGIWPCQKKHEDHLKTAKANPANMQQSTPGLRHPGPHVTVHMQQSTPVLRPPGPHATVNTWTEVPRPCKCNSPHLDRGTQAQM